MTALVAAFDARALNCKEFLKSYLAGGNRIINSYIRQTNRNRHNWNIGKTHGLRFFIRITSAFPYLCLKKNKHTAPVHYVRRHKDFKAQRVDQVATRLPRLQTSYTHEQNTSRKVYPNGFNC